MRLSEPELFFEDFPGFVLYVRDEDPEAPGVWKDVLVADTAHGHVHLLIDMVKRLKTDPATNAVVAASVVVLVVDFFVTRLLISILF